MTVSSREGKITAPVFSAADVTAVEKAIRLHLAL
jgi:hypothetical protein